MIERSQETRWYAVNTKPSGEALAAFNIERLSLPVFFPKIERQSFVFGAFRKGMGPLFPGYIFACFCPATYLRLIQYAPGVKRVVGAGDVLLPVDDDIIRSIQSRQADDGFIRLSAKDPEVGDPVVITQEGSLQGLRGIFDRELHDKQRVMVLLEAIHYKPRMIIDKRHVQSAKSLDPICGDGSACQAG